MPPPPPPHMHMHRPYRRHWFGWGAGYGPGCGCLGCCLPVLMALAVLGVGIAALLAFLL